MQRKDGQLVRGLSPLAATALVAGNMIGSGIYVIPASLADAVGPLALVGWLLTALGYLSLVAIFADLGGAFPVAGGLAAYARRAFGDLAGFQVGALYWLSAVIGNAAFITAFVGYLAVLVPEVGAGWPAVLTAQALLWLLTGINMLGVQAGGIVQIVTTILKIVPLLVLSLALIPLANTANLTPLAPHGAMALFPAFTLIGWLFLGAESVTIPAEEIEGSGATIRRSAYLGYSLATVVYLLVAGTLVLAFPNQALAGSPSPLAVAAKAVLGGWGEKFVTLGALVSTVGVLNGWLLVTGRLPFALARDGLAPAWLGHISPRTGTPISALLVSSFLSGLLVLLYFNQTLLQAYNFIALASTCTALIAMAACCAALPVLAWREKERFSRAQRRNAFTKGWLGLTVIAAMIVGSGADVALWAVLAIWLLVLAYGLIKRSAWDA